MATNLLSKPINLAVEADTRPGCRNPLQDDLDIAKLAGLAVQYPAILDAIASFVAHDVNEIGFTEDAKAAVKRSLLTIVPFEVARDGVNALIAVADRFERECEKGGRDRGKVAKDFSSGLCEAIIKGLMVNAHRNTAEIISDARFSIGGRPINECNVDFFWAQPRREVAEIVECKNHPSWLCDPFAEWRATGNKAKYKHSKIYMIDKVFSNLQEGNWQARVFCVTLRARWNIKRYLDRLLTPPPFLEILALDDLQEGGFPQPLGS